MTARVARIGVAVALVATAIASPLSADDAIGPWVERSDVPLQPWVQSVVPTKADTPIYAEPGKLDGRRGSTQWGTRLPLFATRRANGCMGRWLEVGPFAWICSDAAEYSADPPVSPPLGVRPWGGDVDLARPPRAGSIVALPPIEPASATDDGLPYRYFFAGKDGAYGFSNLETANDDSPDEDLEAGFAVAITQEKVAHGERWGKTTAGRWVALRELVPARPSSFHGLLVTGDALSAAWVVADSAGVFASEKAARERRTRSGTKARGDEVNVYDERLTGTDGLVRISPDGEPEAWMRGRDLARPRVAVPPPEVTSEDERWIDVDLASQTLVAYVGPRPAFATMVSTGLGAKGSDTATNVGTFRIWVKVFTTKMDNLDQEDAENHYAIADVPWVQFFDKAIGFHAAFWHRDFGRVHSHGCVNLAPLDARWLFAFTAPHLPAGWSAVLPDKIELGTVVRVR